MCDQCDKYRAEIDALECRVEELEEELGHTNGELEELGEPIPWSDLD